MKRDVSSPLNINTLKLETMKSFRSRRVCLLWGWITLAPSPPAASDARTPAWPAAPPAAPPGSPRWRLSAGSDRSLYPDPTAKQSRATIQSIIKSTGEKRKKNPQ